MIGEKAYLGIACREVKACVPCFFKVSSFSQENLYASRRCVWCLGK